VWLERECCRGGTRRMRRDERSDAGKSTWARATDPGAAQEAAGEQSSGVQWEHACCVSVVQDGAPRCSAAWSE